MDDEEPPRMLMGLAGLLGALAGLALNPLTWLFVAGVLLYSCIAT